MNTTDKVCLTTSLLSVLLISTVFWLERVALFSNSKNVEVKAHSTHERNFDRVHRARRVIREAPGTWGIVFMDTTQDDPLLTIKSNHTFHGASVMKLLTAVALIKGFEEHKYSRSQSLGEETLSLHLKRMINRSDNESWALLNNFIGYANLQEAVKQYGLYQTNVYTNTTTAHDLATVLKKIYDREILSNEGSQTLLSLMQDTETEDRIPAGLPNGSIVYHKTGTLEDNIHDVGIVITDKPYLLVLMSCNTNRTEGSKTIRLITEALFN